MAPNDQAYAQLLFAGAFIVAQGQGECGNNPIAIGTAKCTACPDVSGSNNNEHNVCVCDKVFPFYFVSLYSSNYVRKPSTAFCIMSLVSLSSIPGHISGLFTVVCL